MLPRLSVLAALLLGACDSSVSIDLSSADGEGLQSVVLSIDGVQLRDGDGTRQRLQTQTSGIEMRDLLAGQSRSLISGFSVAEGRYTGLRLSFDEDAEQTLRLQTGAQFNLRLDDQDQFFDIDLNVEEDEDARLIAVLDLRFSLRQTDADDYRLSPYLRLVNADQAASIDGSISAGAVSSSDCAADGTPGNGVAVYLFKGADAEPIDFNRSRLGPFASAAVRPADNGFAYTLAFLPAGDYRIAWTCDGDIDQPEASETLRFRDAQSISLDEGESRLLNF